MPNAVPSSPTADPGAEAGAESGSRASALTDTRGRSVSYLRLSVTVRCTLRCLYCDSRMRPWPSHDEVLRYDDVDLPEGRLVDRLRAEQDERFETRLASAV